MTGTTPDVRQLVPAALLAAVLVLAGSIGLLSRHLPQNPADAWHFEARGFNFVMGSGGIEGDRMVVDGVLSGGEFSPRR